MKCPLRLDGTPCGKKATMFITGKCNACGMEGTREICEGCAKVIAEAQQRGTHICSKCGSTNTVFSEPVVLP